MHQKRNLIFLVSLCWVLINGCSGCCEDDYTYAGRFELSEHEKSLIPYTDFLELAYVDADGGTTIAQTQPRLLELNEVREGDFNCEHYEYESINNFINFFDRGFTIRLDMSTAFESTILSVEYTETNHDSTAEYFTPLYDLDATNSETITMGDCTFENVYVFTNLEEERKVNTILYSSEGRGIEFILFANGDYLKRD